jgi:predicted dehydrogenase
MRIAVIGAGAWGSNHIKNLSSMGHLTAVVERVDGLRSIIQAKYPEAVTFSTVDEMLKQSNCDAVVVATPAPTHYEIGLKVIQAQKDVLIEKPMTLRSEEAKKLVDLAKDKGVILMVGHLLLYQPAIQWIKKKLNEGFLGRVYSLHQERVKLGRARYVENVTWSLGVHDLAVLLYLADEEPGTVFASGHCGLQEKVADDVYVHMSFPSGVKAHFHHSWLWPSNRRSLTIVGNNGMLVYDEVNQKVVHHLKTIDENLDNHDEGEQILFEGHGEPLALELAHFIDCCKHRSRPLSDGQDGYRVVSVLERIKFN